MALDLRLPWQKKDKVQTVDIAPQGALSQRKLQELHDNGYDLDFLHRIQPAGGLAFDELHGLGGDGYFNVIYVTKYPHDPNLFWLAYLTNNPYTIAEIDIKTDSKEKVVGSINRTLNELGDRAQNDRKQTDQSNAANDWRDLMNYANQLDQAGEIPKLIKVRIMVYAATLELLDQRTADLRAQLKGRGYRANVFLFEQKYEYQSFSASYSQQEKWINNKRGQSLPAATLGKGVPFHYQSLQDPLGYPYGITNTGGTFLFDQFRYTKTRRSFNGMVLGKMGYGKSTFLKMMEEATVVRGNFVRVIDKVKEYEDLAKSQGGIVINLDGSEGRINPWEVFPTITDKDGLVVQEKSSFAQAIAKLSGDLGQLNTDFTDTDMKEVRMLIRAHYVAHGVVPPNFMNKDVKVNITGLQPGQYPTYSSFMAFLRQVQDNPGMLTVNIHKRVLDMLITTITDLLDGHGSMFDGPSTIKNLGDQQIVVYDTSAVANMEPAVYRVQLSSALSLIWADALRNGRKQNYLLRQQRIQPDEIQYLNVLFDESHNLINTNNIAAVEYVSNFEREMRKFRAGVVFATQSPQEMIPEGAASADIAKLKTIFELTQFKVLFNLDDSLLSRMRELLGDSLTDSEYASIPDLEMGQAILSLGSKQSYRVKFQPSERQLELFRGQ
ncbi:ATP-binding protein [Schleiferilactobacillus harbinensis]|uniref:ATP-binding protein n=1 Tax=Schleiferilactobacillus harbinensis TaxID=304207 RepID=A0ABU7T1K8_9LACO